MKNRALTIISLTFAVLVFGRAYAVSTEISSSIEPAPAESPQIDMDGPIKTNDAVDPFGNEAEDQQFCIGSDIHDILIADSARLEQRTREINEREATLQKLELSMTAQLKGIETANAELDKKILALRSGANEDLAHLVGMYQTMKPKQAATIFNSMDPAFAAGFLREMNSNTAGLIMANMDAKKSYSISVLIAQRNAKYR